MPFCHALVHEVQRFGNIVPQMPRATAVDTVFRGYFIPKVQEAPRRGLLRRAQASHHNYALRGVAASCLPLWGSLAARGTPLPSPPKTEAAWRQRSAFASQGTMVIPSLTSALYDKTQWVAPERFDPNHFLDADGDFVKKDAFVPFSIGNGRLQRRARGAPPQGSSPFRPRGARGRGWVTSLGVQTGPRVQPIPSQRPPPADPSPKPCPPGVSGRRSCAGETLAKMEVFIFLVGLLQKFSFQPPPSTTRLDLDLTPVVAFTLRPQPYSACAVPCQ